MAQAMIHGLLLAFGLILPLGAQNTFVLTQGALHRRWVGALPAVVTAALCDTLLITLAVSGLSLVLLTVPWIQTALQWAGVLFLVYMGWSTWRSSPDAEVAVRARPAGGAGGAVDEAWPVWLSLAGHLMGLMAAGVNLQRWLIRVSALIMWGVALQLLLTLLSA